MENNVVEITNEDRLLRRAFFADPQYVREDMTVTSFAFKLRKNEEGLSVDIEQLTTYEKSINDANRFRLFAVNAGDVRALGINCQHKPIEDNYAHAEIYGTNVNKKSSQLAKLATYIPFP
ncbi:MAG: hypothetical protein GXC78_10230 [Chitinophagaceae bacterium]|jgi:hypothetical protein|nr:hypothetical protein [Chitinophagaceae bacterium]